MFMAFNTQCATSEEGWPLVVNAQLVDGSEVGRGLFSDAAVPQFIINL